MRKRGFTFIELIIAVAIFSVISLVVYSAFYMGIKAWRRSQGERDVQEIRLGLLKIEKELKRTFFFSQAPFNGSSSEIVFPLTFSDIDKDRMHIISYDVKKDGDAGLSMLVRKEKIFSEELDQSEGSSKEIFDSMNSIKFEYAYKPGLSSDGFEWRDYWDGEGQGGLPSGVRISLELGKPKEIYTKVIFLEQGALGIK